MKPILIYALIEADTGAIRYVGKTVQTRHSRLHKHRTDKRKCHKASWLKSLAAAGRSVEIVDLEILPHDADWQEAERRWIAHMRAQGCSLTNETDGGEGLHNPSPELRKKLGDNRRGKKQPRDAVERQRAFMLTFRHTDEAKARMSELAKGKIISAEQRAKLSAAFKGKPLSDEHAARIGAAHAGRPKNNRQRAALSHGRQKASSPTSRQKMIETKRMQAEQPHMREVMIANLGSLAAPSASQDQCTMVRQLRSEGYSMRVIAERTGIGQATVHRIINRHGAYAA
jgi:hypothetical protein